MAHPGSVIFKASQRRRPGHQRMGNFLNTGTLFAQNQFLQLLIYQFFATVSPLTAVEQDMVRNVTSLQNLNLVKMLFHFTFVP